LALGDVLSGRKGRRKEGKEGGRKGGRKGWRMGNIDRIYLQNCDDVGDDEQDKEGERPQGLVHHSFW